jgi:hypothetical protein
MPKRSPSLPAGPNRLATISDNTTGGPREIEMPRPKNGGDVLRAPIQAVHLVVAQLTGEEPRRLRREPKKGPAAVELGRRNGRKAGKGRMETKTPKQRKESARRAAGARRREM